MCARCSLPDVTGSDPDHHNVVASKCHIELLVFVVVLSLSQAGKNEPRLRGLRGSVEVIENTTLLFLYIS